MLRKPRTATTVCPLEGRDSAQYLDGDDLLCAQAVREEVRPGPQGGVQLVRPLARGADCDVGSPRAKEWVRRGVRRVPAQRVQPQFEVQLGQIANHAPAMTRVVGKQCLQADIMSAKVQRMSLSRLPGWDACDVHELREEVRLNGSDARICRHLPPAGNGYGGVDATEGDYRGQGPWLRRAVVDHRLCGACRQILMVK